ncbi:hypothetical protein [Dishui Lake phycodnavirus 3]|nr:hypothetical protein [Dishui Lake phycodnavirus 3]
MRRDELSQFLSKCNNVLSQFKRKRREDFIQYGDSRYDDHVTRLLSLTSKVESELRGMDAADDERVVDKLYEEYTQFEPDVEDRLIDSLREEFENVDKEMWYEENFDNWKPMPARQNCDDYSITQRLGYSECRRQMFKHLEDEWKRMTFPTLHDRLEFF